MKKIYMMPNIKVVEAETEEFFAASPGDPVAAVNPDETPIDPNTIESRRDFNLWDDEE